jgi:hypothetical protein
MSADVFEPADPRRTMPKSLVIGAVIAAVLLIALMSFLNRRSLDQTEPNAVVAANESAPAAPSPAPPVASGQVVLTATGPAWVEVTDQGTTLFQGELQPGQVYTVPATAKAPMLKAGKPEALKVTVGTTAVPQVGPAGKVTTVSLLPADLLGAPAATAPPPATVSAPPASPRPRARRAAPAPAPAPPPATPLATQPITNGQ